MWPKVSTHHATNRIDPRYTHQMTSINNDPPFTVEKLMNQPINQLLQLLDVTIPHPPSEPTGWTQWACDQLENPRNICRQITHHVHEGEIPRQYDVIRNKTLHNCHNYQKTLCSHPNHPRPPRKTGVHRPWIPNNARHTIPTNKAIMEQTNQSIQVWYAVFVQLVGVSIVGVAVRSGILVSVSVMVSCSAGLEVRLHPKTWSPYLSNEVWHMHFNG